MAMDESKENRTFQLNRVRNQYFSVIVANLLMTANGLVLGWPVQFLPKLESIDTPLASGPLSSGEISWVIGIGPIGSLLSCTILVLTFWLLIHFATDLYWILAARFISGCTSGTIYLALILFISEVANDE